MLKEVVEVAVAVINTSNPMQLIATGLALVLATFSIVAQAAVLPKERADLLYHRYDGGGMEIDGPSLLVRKNIAEKVSIAANYYVDNVSSASVDVIASGATSYTEERKEHSLDVTVLEDKALINIGYTRSTESDYEASSYRIDISQDFFGDMITASMGYSQADDDVSRNSDDPNDDFSEQVERRHYRTGISWILSKSLYINLNYEGISDEGYLNNPYRSVRFSDDPIDGPVLSQTETYPRTRNSDALSLKFSYHLANSSAIKAQLGHYSDSWDINANSFGIEYSQKFNQHWLADFRVRYYQQSAAEFYADIFTPPTLENRDYRARDKELSKFSNYSIGFGGSYIRQFNQYIEEARLSLQFDYLQFDYDNFREATPKNTSAYGLGNEPLYSFDAYTLRLFISVFY